MDFERDQQQSCMPDLPIKTANHPICVTEWMDDAAAGSFKTREGEITGPWQSHPKQCYGIKPCSSVCPSGLQFAGIYDKG